MSAPDAWRQELRKLIPRGFLRRSQGTALFASDYPRFPGAETVTASLIRAGYRVTADGAAAQIDGSEEKYRALFRGLSCPFVTPTDETLWAVSLARRLAAAETPPEDEPLALYPTLLKALDQGKWQDAAQTAAAFSALCLRQKKKLPSAAGKLILLALTEQKGENASC